MQVSILIPTYNRPDFLKAAIMSIWKQTILPSEIIIGDDSQDDQTEKLVIDMSDISPIPIHYYHHRPSKKQTKNVDFLFQQANSDFLMLLHDDDLLFPCCIELLSKPFKENDDIIASFGNQILIRENGEIIEGSEKTNEEYFRTPERAGIVDSYMAGAVSMFPNDGYLIRKDYAQKIGYDDNNRAGDGVDFYFGYRLGKLNKPFYYVSELTAKYRVTSTSISNSLGYDAAYFAVKILLEDCQSNLIPEIEKVIKDKMPMAISVAAFKKERKTALVWMFSKYYKGKIFSLRGIKRLALIFKPF